MRSVWAVVATVPLPANRIPLGAGTPARWGIINGCAQRILVRGLKRSAPGPSGQRGLKHDNANADEQQTDDFGANESSSGD